MCATEYLAICTPDGRAIGRGDRAVIHRHRLLHRAVHIVVCNAGGEVCLQRRGPHKDEHPDCWAISVGGHVEAGESPVETAHRELREELGLEGPIEHVGDLLPSPSNGWEHVTVFQHIASADPRIDGHEVTEVRWFPVEEIEKCIADPNFPTAPSLDESHRLWCEWTHSRRNS